jgi:3-oxoacyl-(acyl-carrier-protein) synthase
MGKIVMIQPVISQYGIRSALGNLNETWQNILAGKTGLSPFDHPEISTWVGRIQQLTSTLGSAERIARLLDLGLQDLPRNQLDPHTHIIVATTKGAIDDLGKNNRLQSWQIADYLKKKLHLQGQATTVSSACTSGTIGLIQACQKICTGEAAAVLVIGIDILSMFVLSGFQQLLALSETKCTPFDMNRNGLSLGEGLGYILICHPDLAREQNHKPLAAIRGWGVSGDAGHITAPCRQGSGLIRVFSQTTRNKRNPVGAIHAHGTGTIYNDAMEITAMNHFFTSPVPFYSVKGAIGHCLGAAGVMEAALSILSLQYGIIPPTTGLTTVDPHTAMATGEKTLPLHYPAILSCNSGFGGINAGILLEKPAKKN